tara:strand:+ start:49 stop:267 length:219 start_codon:yes stop_codon:yes gene_type:complete
MQHTIDIETDLKEFTSTTMIAGSTIENKRLDLVVCISNGEANIFYKVYKNKICVIRHGSLRMAVKHYNGIKA